MLTQISQNTQRVVCMFAAVAIVVAALLGAFSTQHAQHDNYSVTITQLQ